MNTQETCNKRTCWALTQDLHFCKHGRNPWKPFCSQHLTRKYVLVRLGFGILTVLGSLASIIGLWPVFMSTNSGGSISTSTSRASSADPEMTYAKAGETVRNAQQDKGSSEVVNSDSPQSDRLQGESQDKTIALRTQETILDKNDPINRPQYATRRVASNQADVLRALHKPTTKEEVLKALYGPTTKQEVLKVLYPSVAMNNTDR